MAGSYLPEVKQQYEELPYPLRDPAEEGKRLIHTVGDNLLVANHFCFRGRRDFSRDFSCLVAGGGTGDSLIYLAEQLRKFDAEVVYLDLSTASRAIAEGRAAKRRLENIRWITGSILDLPSMDLGQFDYINCSGVLHHLESTEQGLAALNAVLKDDGAMFLMLYGSYARREVYDMQELLRRYLPPGLPTAGKVAMTRELLAGLPMTNSFRRNWSMWEWEISQEAGGFGDVGLYDLLLHSQDRCFDVPGIYALAAGAGLTVAGFPMGTYRYEPGNLVTDPEVRAHLAILPLEKRQALAEMMSCVLRTHEFYLTRQPDRAARLDDEELAPLLFWSMYGRHAELAARIEPGKTFTYEDGGRAFSLVGNEISRALMAGMDGKAPIRELLDRVTTQVPGVTRDRARQELRSMFDFLHPQGYLFLMEPGTVGTRLPDFRRFGTPSPRP